MTAPPMRDFMKVSMAERFSGDCNILQNRNWERSLEEGSEDRWGGSLGEGKGGDDYGGIERWMEGTEREADVCEVTMGAVRRTIC